MRAGRARRRLQSGVVYLLTLFAVAALGLGLAQFGQVWAKSVQRERETELLFIGGEFARALARYKAAGPGVGPAELNDLVTDKRVPVPRRHLRRIYRDPMTGKADWIVERREGQIVGVRSRSEQSVLRRQGLPDWVQVIEVAQRTRGGFRQAPLSLLRGKEAHITIDRPGLAGETLTAMVEAARADEMAARAAREVAERRQRLEGMTQRAERVLAEVEKITAETREAVLAGLRDARAVLQTQDDELIVVALEAFTTLLRPLPGELGAIGAPPAAPKRQARACEAP